MPMLHADDEMALVDHPLDERNAPQLATPQLASCKQQQETCDAAGLRPVRLLP
jgi:hypothetical protein